MAYFNYAIAEFVNFRSQNNSLKVSKKQGYQNLFFCCKRGYDGNKKALEVIQSDMHKPNKIKYLLGLKSVCTYVKGHKTLVKKMEQPRPLFHLYWSFQTRITIFTTNKCEKMSIQYMVRGFEPMTFGTWVSSHKHKTRAPSLTRHLLPMMAFHSFASLCSGFKTSFWKMKTN